MTKLSKKFMSLAIATFVTVSSAFGGNVDTAKAAETATTTYDGMTDTAYTVHFKMPSNWMTSEAPRVYSYHIIDDGKDEGANEDDPIFRDVWPGNKMTKNSDGWYTAVVNSKNLTNTSLGKVKTYVIFTNGVSEKKDEYGNVITYVDPIDKKTCTEYNVTYRIPLETTEKNDHEGYPISSDVWFDAGTMTKPSTSKPGTTATATPSATPTKKPTTSPSATPTKAPTATPTSTPTTVPVVVPTVEPVTGPQVSANVENKDVVNGNYFYEEDSDYINVKVNLAEGATSATYSIDNGPEKAITGPTTVKVGEGKIANSAITLTVKSTDGKTTNVQNFTYFKATKVEAPKKLSTAMFKLFNTVSALANGTEVTVDAASVNAATTNKTVHFKPPVDAEKWPSTNSVYVYAYYGDDKDKTEVTGPWPGKKAEKDANGYYTCKISEATDKITVIFASVSGELGEMKLSSSQKWYYECNVTTQLPNGFKTDENGNKIKDEFGNDIPLEGFEVSQETWFTGDKATTVNPNPTATPKATPTTKPTATPTKAPTATPTVAPTFAAYFGAEKSAPQYNTTKQTISAVAVNATGKVTYSFAVDGKVIYQGENNSTAWDASGLEAGSHTLTAVITDEAKHSVGLAKTYELVKAAPTATPVVTATATAVVATATPTVVPTATPVVTATPVAIATATPTAIPTVVPTAIPTATPTAIPTIEPTAVVVVPTPVVPNGDAVVTPAALSGTISFSKTGKTAGETITIKAKGKNGTPKYKYTYYVVKGSKTTKLASNTTKTSVQWTPSAAGKYTIKVKITDAAKKTKTVKKTYTVKARVITIKSFKTNKKSGQKVKTKITLTAKATTKKGKVSYKFAAQKGSGKITTIKGYSSKAKKVWKPTKKGTYTLYVYVKNGKGVVVTKTMKFKIK